MSPRRKRTALLSFRRFDDDVVVEGLENRWIGGVEGPHSAIRLDGGEIAQIFGFIAGAFPHLVDAIDSRCPRPLAIKRLPPPPPCKHCGLAYYGIHYEGCPALEPQGAPAQRVDQPEQPAEEHQAADFDGLGVRGEDPQQQAQNGEHERPHSDEHAVERTPDANAPAQVLKVRKLRIRDADSGRFLFEVTCQRCQACLAAGTLNPDEYMTRHIAAGLCKPRPPAGGASNGC